MSDSKKTEMVNLKIDGREVSVPVGTNIIEAAKLIDVEIPHYCYHQDLSIAGNCRMCQVEVSGMKKLEIGCNCVAKEGMEVKTHHSSDRVKEAQASTLEFLLINHPLDCTVCDQAGHCKLQDYHFEYNAKESRFIEEKEHKVKALPLGPTVMLDGERCILCTRCVRFCDEVTKSSELGVLNRGDRSVISVNPNKVLDNPLSGNVVDLCPVGALTHKKWRFNSRIWFTKMTDTICPGCSTGCNCKVAVRDREVVQVKGRFNASVNREWLCDEGRYGFDRFLPKERHTKILSSEPAANSDEVFRVLASKLKGQPVAIFLSPNLLLEDYFALKSLCSKYIKGAEIALAYKTRALNEIERILVSPDYAANFAGAVFSGIVSGDLQAKYQELLVKVKSGGYAATIFVGDRSICADDLSPAFAASLGTIPFSLFIGTDSESALSAACKYIIPSRSILERSGLMVNRFGRLQFSDRVLDPLPGTEPEWRIFNRLAEKLGAKFTSASTDRDMTNEILRSDSRLSGLSISSIKRGGIDLKAVSQQAEGFSVGAAGQV